MGFSGRIRSLFVVGRGGMGSVEVAMESKDDGAQRIVALKRMLPTAVLDKRQAEMFMREAKLATLLSHPNVVHASSFGENDGELFLVMEYIEGEPLSKVVSTAYEREGGLPLSLIAHILAEICEGLHAAHELVDEAGRPLNVVHRDVSPHNVMVAYEGQVKLLDFGVAKIEALDAEGRTKTGEVKGKTSYMSPEQAMGDPIDRRSDLYSLGAVLFEAVSGKKMWGGGTDLEVLRRLALEEPPRLEDVAPSTPAAIASLQRRLVMRDPAKRPSTALDVARELRSFIALTGARPDARVVRTVMTRLFAAEIERRRVTLQEALAQAGPTASDELRASLSVPPSGDMTPTSAAHSSHPVAVRSSRLRWAFTAGACAMVAGVLVALIQWNRASTAGVQASPANPAAPATAAPPARPVPEPESKPADTPGPPPSARAEPSAPVAATSPPQQRAPAPPPSVSSEAQAASASARAPSGPAAPPGRTAPEPAVPARDARTAGAPAGSPARPPPRSAAPAPTQPNNPLDVDPTPF